MYGPMSPRAHSNGKTAAAGAEAKRCIMASIAAVKQHKSRSLSVLLAMLLFYLLVSATVKTSLERQQRQQQRLPTPDSGINVNAAGTSFLLKCGDVPVTHAALLEYITNIQLPAIAALQNYTRADYLQQQQQHDHHQWLVMEINSEHEMYGGLGDRTRGVVGALLTAIAFNRAFAVHWTEPVAVSSVYQHTLIDWQQTMLFYNDSLLKQQMSSNSSSSGSIRTPTLHKLSHSNIELDGLSLASDRLILPLSQQQQHRNTKFITLSGNSHLYTDLSSHQLTRARMQHYGFSEDTDIDTYYPCLHSALFTLSSSTMRYVTALLLQQQHAVDFKTEKVWSLKVSGQQQQQHQQQQQPVHVMCYQHRSGSSSSSSVSSSSTSFSGDSHRISLQHLPTAVAYLQHKVFEETYTAAREGRATDILLYVTADDSDAVTAVQAAFSNSNSNSSSSNSSSSNSSDTRMWPNVHTFAISGHVEQIDLEFGDFSHDSDAAAATAVDTGVAATPATTTATAAASSLSHPALVSAFRKAAVDFWLLGVCDSAIVSQGSGFALLGLQRKQSSAAVLPVKLQVLMESGKLARYSSYRRQFAACAVSDKCKTMLA